MLRKTLGRLVKYGRLTVIRPDGTELQFGGVQAAVATAQDQRRDYRNC
jgi:hypothetical protein